MKEIITTMIKHGMPFSEYQSHPAINHSGLKLIERSPSHYIWDKQNERKETTALKLGSAIHSAILEPKEFEEKYITAGNIDKRTKSGKEAYAALEMKGKIILSIDEYDTVKRCVESVYKNVTATELLKDGRPEVSVFGSIKGIECKCRPDWLRSDGIVVDIKSTCDASLKEFSRSVLNYGYHSQAAFYIDVLKSNDISTLAFIFIAIEKLSKPNFNLRN
jgi:exodeoxyribonuclease VIII